MELGHTWQRKKSIPASSGKAGPNIHTEDRNLGTLGKLQFETHGPKLCKAHVPVTNKFRAHIRVHIASGVCSVPLKE